MTISPSPRADLCRVGDYLDVKCSINETILRWELVQIGRDAFVQRDITSTQKSQEIVTVDSTVLVFSRISELGAQPLESTLEISSVGQSLNGSTITCMESSTRDMAPMATTTIHIVGENDGRLLADATSLKHKYHLTLIVYHSLSSQSTKC